MNRKQFLTLVQKRVAETAVGASAMRSQGRGVVKAVRGYLRSVHLRRFAKRSQKGFQNALDEATNELRRSLPRGSRNWGAARKALNLFLRDVQYNRYLCSHYHLDRVGGWLEVPLDSFTAKGIRRETFLTHAVPRWPGVKHLTAKVSAVYQEAARHLAQAEGTDPVHLDLVFWRE